ncbi:MAG: ACP S-malonyltransferase [Gemmatimonadaceae bacterium]
MGRDIAEACRSSRDTFAAVDAALGLPLSAIAWGTDNDVLTLTHNAQPALLAHGLALWAATRDILGPHVRAAAGHSLGEVTAYAAAGALSVEDAARLVRSRGESMLEAGKRHPGAMTALLGALDAPIDELCREASVGGEIVVPANYNAADQVVISGSPAGVARATALAKAAGARRAVTLAVSGAFHSPLMQDAVLPLCEALDACSWTDLSFPVYSNVTEEPNVSPTHARSLLCAQLTAPVRWVGEVRGLAASFPNALFVEMGPGNVLTGLVKRIAPTVRTATCGTAADVERLLLQAGV